MQVQNVKIPNKEEAHTIQFNAARNSLQQLKTYSPFPPPFFFSCDRLVFFCVPLTLFWLLVLAKDHHLEVSHHLFDISGEEHMAIQRQSPVWHHRPQGKVGIVKTPDWGLWTLPDCLHPSATALCQRGSPFLVRAFGFAELRVVSSAQAVGGLRGPFAEYLQCQI